jgi:plastocyanin
MKVESTKLGFFSRRPLSAFSKTAVATLLGVIVLGVLMWLAVGVIPFLYIASVMLLLAGLILSGIRWMPLLGSLVGIFFLYVLLFQTTFPLYHLSHPKDAVSNPLLSFGLFVIIAVILWCMVMTVGAGVGAIIQNYWQRERGTPRWFVPALSGLIGLLLGAILIAALAQPATATATTTTTSGEATVHLGISTFSQPSVTVAKGAKLKLIDDGTFEHILFNGSWVNGQPSSQSQVGAPSVKNLMINGTGKSVEIGPFSSAGTYHIYCSIHSGMTLTIIVQ